jgi:hypothetical protein
MALAAMRLHSAVDELEHLRALNAKGKTPVLSAQSVEASTANKR